ncbi:MAG TPA: NADPH:quinone reductase [Verrucomicrobiota bacterium]|nr:NADPH:quinone reductase [Verrucomicrobiota bacterium]
MKAAFIRKLGPPEVIEYGEFPIDNPKGKQVLVRVKAVSVNPIDVYIRAGLVQMGISLPYIIGCDLAGVVEEVGAQVTKFKKGDRVWGTNQGLFGRQGTFAEFALVEEEWLYPTPMGVSDEDIAAIALVGITSHLGLFREAKLKSGETIFVNGGSGGIGSTVIQMAKAIGATVYASAGSEEKVNLCKKLGAKAAFNYKEKDIEREIKNVEPNGVNVWWETSREPDFDKIILSLAVRGRIIIMAGREARPQFPVGPFYVKDCKVFGFAMFNATSTEQMQCANDINKWMAEGKLKPLIDRVLPLSQAALAHKLQEENTIWKRGNLSGKIVLKP